MIRLLAVAAAGVVALSIFAVATAAPGQESTIVLTCGTDSIDVISNGGGAWSPARDPETGAVYHPVAFSNVSGTFTDGEGTVTPFEEDDIERKAPPHVDLFECSFEGNFVNKGGTAHVTGDVVGYTTGR